MVTSDITLSQKMNSKTTFLVTTLIYLSRLMVIGLKTIAITMNDFKDLINNKKDSIKVEKTNLHTKN